MTTHSVQTWLLFNALIIALLILDLGVFNRKAHVIKLKEAFGWSVFWILLGLGFGAFVYNYMGHTAGIEYVTGYVVEKSLSVDNLFVFLIIFRAFKIEKKFQHRLLFWGVLGAIILRGLMIAAGTQLLAQFHWVIYLFGAFLVYTGLKLFKGGENEFDPTASPVLKFVKKFLPFTDAPHPNRFLVIENGVRKFTLTFATLLLIESSDVVFALDSVPAVFGVTRDPFIVYTSNIFAILGLRSLFFVLEDFMDRFHLLKYGLAVVLTLVGTKMIVEPFFHVPAWASLVGISVILTGAVIASLMIPEKSHKDDAKKAGA
jgi:tellurite resistance protein TerC